MLTGWQLAAGDGGIGNTGELKQQFTRKEEIPTSEWPLVTFSAGHSAPLYFGFNTEVSKLLIVLLVSDLICSQQSLEGCWTNVAVDTRRLTCKSFSWLH